MNYTRTKLVDPFLDCIQAVAENVRALEDRKVCKKPHPQTIVVGVLQALLSGPTAGAYQRRDAVAPLGGQPAGISYDVGRALNDAHAITRDIMTLGDDGTYSAREPEVPC